jgi:hypothetical protein
VRSPSPAAPLRITFDGGPGARLVTPCGLVHGPLHGCAFLVPRETPEELLVGLPDGGFARYVLVGWWNGRAQYKHDEDSKPVALRRRGG